MFLKLLEILRKNHTVYTINEKQILNNMYINKKERYIYEHYEVKLVYFFGNF